MSCASSSARPCSAFRCSEHPRRGAIMSRTIWVGAVAYDPKVVGIWEGMRRYFHEEAHVPVEVVLVQGYEAQVASLLAEPAEALPLTDIGSNTNLALVIGDVLSNRRF